MTTFRWQLAFLILAPILLLVGCSNEPKGINLEQLRQQTHIHGLAFDRSDNKRLWLATHHGFHVVDADSMARQVSEESHDFMGFTPHPHDAEIFFASGHPARGGNLGVVVSTDGGHTWVQRSPGVDGPVDFHQLTVSEADPDVLYGAYAGQLQISQDAGQSWQIQARVPAGLIGLAASSHDSAHLYAATRAGLLVSHDGGQRWRQVHPESNPVSLVMVHEGQLYAFMLGVGLMTASEATRDWEVVKSDWGERYLTHLAIDPTDSQHLVAANDQGQLMRSIDGGQLWENL